MDTKYIPKPDNEGGIQVLIWPLGAIIEQVSIVCPTITILIKNKE